jgi:hypothetical protein
VVRRKGEVSGVDRAAQRRRHYEVHRQASRSALRQGRGCGGLYCIHNRGRLNCNG